MPTIATQPPCQVQSSRLPNGVRVLTERIETMRGVGLAILADVGPQDEPPHHEGLAHLCEHAFFLGTKLRSEQDIACLIDTAGGQLGGFTARDYTCLHTTVSADYVTYAMDLMGDLVTGNDFTETRLRREIDVIGHEIEAHRDSAESTLDSDLKRCLWGNDPLARTLLGTQQSISRLTKRDVQDFIRTQYTPDRLIVAAAGDIHHDVLVDLTQDAFWQLTGTDTRTPRGEVRSIGGVLVESTPRRMATLSIMIPAPPYCDPRRYALHVLVNLLGGGLSSRLYRDLRERQGLAYDVSAQLHAYGRGGVLVIDITTSPDSVMAAVTAVFGHLTQLAWDDQSIGEEELWKAKMQTRGQAYLASDSIQTRVSRMATQQLYFRQPIDDSSLLAEIDAVDRDDVCSVAQQVIGEGITRCAIGVTGVAKRDADLLRCELNALRDCFAFTAENSLQINDDFPSTAGNAT